MYWTSSNLISIPTIPYCWWYTLFLWFQFDFLTILSHEEENKVLNDCYLVVCGSYLSGYATTQKFLCAIYFWPSLFKAYTLAVQKCYACQIYNRKMCTPFAPLHPAVIIGPFTKLGIDFMTFNPHSVEGAWVYYHYRRLFYKIGRCDAYI